MSLSGPVRIRAMADGDLERVVEIAVGLPTAPHWARRAYAAAIDAQGAPRRIALVAEVEEGVAGFVVAAVIRSEAELESIAVDAGAQGQGIGMALLDALLDRLRLDGIEELTLEVRESNAAAVRLYGRAGFVETGRRRGYYREPVEDAVAMGLRVQN